ncbi:MAG: hypothetical protein ABIE70_11385 [bacterium]
MIRYSVVVLLFLVGLPLVAPVQARMPRPEPIEREHFTLYLDNPHLSDRVDSVLTHVRRRLAGLLGDSLISRPQVFVTESEDYFKYLVGGRFPDWGAAAAIPSRSMIVLKSPEKFNVQKPLEQLLAHELAHLALAERLHGFRAPRWFDEGLAMMVSTEWSWNDNLTMGRAAVFGSFVGLNDIEGLNRLGQSRAHQSYAQSYLAVKYFYDEYGAAQVRLFLDSLATGTKMDLALRAATGADSHEFETELFESFRQRYNLTALLMDTMFIWLGLALVVVIAFIMRYNKRRAYYKKWAEEEKLHSTDFDYGDSDNPEQVDDDEPWRG